MSYGVFECSDWLDLTSPVESDRLPFPTVSFLLPETLSRLSCDSSLILEPATMMKEA